MSALQNLEQTLVAVAQMKHQPPHYRLAHLFDRVAVADPSIADWLEGELEARGVVGRERWRRCADWLIERVEGERESYLQIIADLGAHVLRRLVPRDPRKDPRAEVYRRLGFERRIAIEGAEQVLMVLRKQANIIANACSPEEVVGAVTVIGQGLARALLLMATFAAQAWFGRDADGLAREWKVTEGSRALTGASSLGTRLAFLAKALEKVPEERIQRPRSQALRQYVLDLEVVERRNRVVHDDAPCRSRSFVEQRTDAVELASQAVSFIERLIEAQPDRIFPLLVRVEDRRPLPENGGWIYDCTDNNGQRRKLMHCDVVEVDAVYFALPSSNPHWVDPELVVWKAR